MMQSDAVPPSMLSPTSSSNDSIDDDIVDVGDGVELAPVHDDVRDDIICAIFNLPNSTIFYQDFSCALVSTIVYHGRMYPAGDQMCFYSNLFGKETKLLIPYATISDVSKTSSMFSHGLRIHTVSQKEYSFSSFWGNNRDHCAAIIVALRQKSLGVASPLLSFAPSPPPSAATAAPSPPVDNAPVPPASTSTDQPPPSSSNSVATSPLTPDEHQHPFMDVAHDTFAISSDEFVDLFLSERAIYGIAEANRRRGATDIVCGEWTPDQDGRVYTRSVTFTQPVDAPIGPKSSRVDVRQSRYHVNDTTMHVDTTTKLHDIPYGDCFKVDDRMIMTWSTPSSCDVVMQLRVVFVKSTLWRSLIESRAKAECKQKSVEWLELAKAAVSPAGLPAYPAALDPVPTEGAASPRTHKRVRAASATTSPFAKDTRQRLPAAEATGVAALEPLKPTRHRPTGGRRRRLASIVIPWAVIGLLVLYIRHIHSELVDIHETLRHVEKHLQLLAPSPPSTTTPQCPVVPPPMD